ncbi:MAG: TatD family hydrolase [Anaerolineae bacterium]
MWIDAHAHLDHYGEALPVVLDEISRLHILTFSVSMDVDSYQQARAIAARSPYVVPCFGIHPWEAPRFADDLPALDQLIASSPMLGEIGLDTVWVEDPTTYPAQRRVFEYFLAAARDQDKVVNLHTKGAEWDVLDLLRRYDVRRAIVHWYSGPLDALDELIAWGAYFTIGVEVLRSEAIRTIARRIPEEQLLTETDNPGGWEWLSGEAGMPHLVMEVLSELATLRGTNQETLAAQVRANLARLIGDDPRLVSLHSLLAGA